MGLRINARSTEDIVTTTKERGPKSSRPVTPSTLTHLARGTSWDTPSKTFVRCKCGLWLSSQSLAISQGCDTYLLN